MTSRVSEICLDVNDLHLMARFWSAALELPATVEEEAEIELSPGLVLLLLPVPEPRTVKNRMHLDLSPTSLDQHEEVARLEALGARRVDIGQGDVGWVVLADPEGNEFCVLSGRPEP